MDTVSHIVKLLGELTQGKSKEEKLKFLNAVGYTSFADIEKLVEDDKILLLNRLKVLAAPYVKYNLNGIVVTRPEAPTHVKQISFAIPK